MSRARIVLVSVLAVAVGWLVWPTGDVATLQPESGEAAGRTPLPPADTSGPVAASDATTPPGDARTEVAVDAPAGQPPIPADATWLTVTIVDGATQQPVAGAEVLWVDSHRWKLMQKLPFDEHRVLVRDTEQICRRFGWRTRSDKDGGARIHVTDDFTSVVARDGARFGEAGFARRRPPSETERRIALAVDLTVRARVLGANGTPAAGVPVAFERHDPSVEVPRRTGREVSSDRDGIATFAHLQANGMFPGPPGRDGNAAWSLRVAIPGLEVEPVLIDAKALPSEPVTLRLPPTGSLRARVTFDGRPLPGAANLGLAVGPLAQSTTSQFRFVTIPEWKTGTDADGWAHFEHVPLGKALFLRPPTGATLWDNLEVQGPTVQDQQVVASLDLSQLAVALAGRILQPDGTPCAEQPLSIRSKSTVAIASGVFTTDATGRFFWVLGRPRTDMTALHLDELTISRGYTHESSQQVHVEPRALQRGRNELGDLRMAVPPLVVGGRFECDAAARQKTVPHIERLQAFPGHPNAKPQWIAVHDVLLNLAETGAFEVRGDVPAGRYRLGVQPGEHLPVEPIEFPLGKSDLIVVIRRGTPMSAKCRLPEGLAPSTLRLELHSASPAATIASDVIKPQVAADVAEYSWQAIPTGTWTLHVRGRGFAVPFVTIADVVVPPPPGGDSRLQDIDLRSVIHLLRLHVTAEPDVVPPPMGRAAVFAQPQNDDRWWLGFDVGIGETVTVPMTQPPIDLLVGLNGCKPVLLRAPSGTAQVHLGPWPRLDVRVLGAEAMPADIHLMLSLALTGPAADRNFFIGARSGSVGDLVECRSSQRAIDGRAQLAIGDGTHRLWAYLRLGENGRTKGLRDSSPKDVVPGGAVTLQLSPDEIRAAIDELRATNGANK